MGKQSKQLCKWKKDDIEQKIENFAAIVRNPKFICTKCGRVADKKKWLHQPLGLDHIDEKR